jgi:hypothetical protein
MAIKVANNQSLTAITALPSAITSGAMTLLETQTASSSATLSFTSNIDDTYDEYVFKFYDIHPATNSTDFTFQVDTGTNTSYNQTMTTTVFRALHDEADTAASMSYDSGRDQAQGTGFQILAHEIGNDNDSCVGGSLHLFDPSNTTFVKHFISTVNLYAASNMSENKFTAGYVNTTTALTRVQFKMSSGNVDAGTIKMYGVA